LLLSFAIEVDFVGQMMKYFVMMVILQQEIQKFYIEKQITVKGRNCPRPVFSFDEVGFPGRLNTSYNLYLL